MLGLHPGDKELGRSEWISRRIGKFSFRDGAVMVEARGELSPTGCFAIEMRHQAYKDRRYIRSNWLCLDPHDGHIHIQTDGIWNEMQIVADHQHDGSTPVRPPGEWNTFLFLASGDHLKGWVNGERAIAGWTVAGAPATSAWWRCGSTGCRSERASGTCASGTAHCRIPPPSGRSVARRVTAG